MCLEVKREQISRYYALTSPERIQCKIYEGKGSTRHRGELSIK